MTTAKAKIKKILGMQETILGIPTLTKLNKIAIPGVKDHISIFYYLLLAAK